MDDTVMGDFYWFIAWDGVLGTVGCCEVQWELKPVLLWDRHLQSVITFRGINPCWKIFVAGWRAVIDSTCTVIFLATVLHFVLQTFTLTHDYRLNSGNRENHEREFFKAKNATHTKNSSWLIMIGFWTNKICCCDAQPFTRPAHFNWVLLQR